MIRSTWYLYILIFRKIEDQKGGCKAEGGATVNSFTFWKLLWDQKGGCKAET